MESLIIPQKLVHEKFYVHGKLLHTRNCHRKFVQNLLPEIAKKKLKPINRDLNRD